MELFFELPFSLSELDGTNHVSQHNVTMLQRIDFKLRQAIFFQTT